jgi:hypothetical protein
MLASRRWGCFWFSAFSYAAVAVHNVTFTAAPLIFSHFLIYGEKPDTNHQQFGVKGWISRREDQRKDAKFDARGEPCIFVGYQSNQHGSLVWCPARGSNAMNAVVDTTNVFFGTRLPRAMRPAIWQQMR